MKKIFLLFLLLFVSATVACGPNDIYKTRGQKVSASVLSKRIEEVQHTNVSRPWIHTTFIRKKITVSFMTIPSGEAVSSYHNVEITVSDEEYEMFYVGDKMNVYYLNSNPDKVRTEDQVEGPMVRWK